MINVLIIEPDPEERISLIIRLSGETGIRVIRAVSDPPAIWRVDLPAACVDVVLINVDQVAMTTLRSWAVMHVLVPDARVLALTQGADERVLESALGAGVTALHRPNAASAILCRAVRNAAQGLVDFDPELIERAKRVVLAPLTETQIRFGGLTIDLRAQEVTRWGRHIHLTPLEFKLLAYLASNGHGPARLAELLEAVWEVSPKCGGTLAQVHNCIKRIRQKIEPDAHHPRYLVCERGWGYILQDPTSREPTFLSLITS